MPKQISSGAGSETKSHWSENKAIRLVDARVPRERRDPARAARPPARGAVRLLAFAGDMVRPPRAWLERTVNVVRVTEPARGGHIAPFEAPELYAEELRAFFRPYRAAATG
jgi:pimeloyl-ACP methyl ester carboxylesterase